MMIAGSPRRKWKCTKRKKRAVANTTSGTMMRAYTRPSYSARARRGARRHQSAPETPTASETSAEAKAMISVVFSPSRTSWSFAARLYQ